MWQGGITRGKGEGFVVCGQKGVVLFTRLDSLVVTAFTFMGG